jgi:hypothetical protein
MRPIKVSLPSSPSPDAIDSADRSKRPFRPFATIRMEAEKCERQVVD